MIDLGHGHELRWAAWRPDRDLNPQYDGLPDLDRCAAIVRHPLRPDDADENCRRLGYCEGTVTLDGEVQRRLFPGQDLWQVESWEPLTLSPSLLCHCGDHGFIQQGRWVPA